MKGMTLTVHETRQAQAAPVPEVPVVPMYGMSFSRMNMKDTVRYLTEAIEQRRTTQVITGNPIMIMTALENPIFHRAMREAELLVPDGAGAVWAANYVGMPVAERVAGFDLLHELLHVGEQKRWSVYLLGTTQEVIDEAADRLKRQYPLVRFVGTHHGFFGDGEDAEVIAKIREADPDMLFVARGVHNQEPWIAKHKQALGIPVMMGIGGSLDVIAGKLKRAPVFMQRLGLEWLYRLMLQPSRIGRMLVLPKFVIKVMRDRENVTKEYPTP